METISYLLKFRDIVFTLSIVKVISDTYHDTVKPSQLFLLFLLYFEQFSAEYIFSRIINRL